MNPAVIHFLKTYIIEIFYFGGVSCLSIAAHFIYPPAAWIVWGLALMIPAIIAARKE